VLATGVAVRLATLGTVMEARAMAVALGRAVEDAVERPQRGQRLWALGLCLSPQWGQFIQVLSSTVSPSWSPTLVF
jgi:hypothetical protein